MMNNLSTTRASVLARAANGDADEFAQLYAPLAYAVARKRGLKQDDAEDIAQQVMMELLRMLPGFDYDRSRGSFKGLVKKIVGNRVTDSMRRRRPEPAGEMVEQAATANTDLDALFEREWQKVHLSAALDRVRMEVKPTTYQAFQLTFLDEVEPARVADMLGISTNQVAQYKCRVVQRLRGQLEDLLRETE